MTPYKSKSKKKSGVTAYEIGDDFVLVQFNSTQTYKYTYRSAGHTAIEAMNRLAHASEGLSSFISKNYPA